jgi:hypothetical protein
VRKLLVFLFFHLSATVYSQDATLVEPLISKRDSGFRNEEGSNSTINLDVNSITLLKNEYPDLTGNQIHIGLKENLPDIQTLDLVNKIKITNSASKEVSDHATRMAAVLVGSGISNPINEGILKNAQLVSTDFKQLQPEPLSFYQENNVYIINHSYGSGIENYYGAEAQAYDSFCFKNPDILHVFSSGNLGYTFASDGNYKGINGFGNLTGNYKTAKNVLTVGAVNEYNQLLPSSSRGPAFDGRIKPELVAYSDEGTSAAAAIVSGTAALLQQTYQEQKNKVAPAALLKAILINSADDVGNPGPDFETGYGNVNAYEAVKVITEARFIEASVAIDGKFAATIDIPQKAKNLKVTLVYSDMAADLNTATALINDLDLEVTSNKAERFLPWVLNAFPDRDSLIKPVIRSADHINNIEQVSVAGDLNSSYTIHVSGNKVINALQPFYIAYQWEEAESFLWVSPVATSKLFSGQPAIIRWKTNLTPKTANIEISQNGGAWKLIYESVHMLKGYADIILPETFSKMKLRMVSDGKSYESDTFKLSPKIEAAATFFCKDSLGLQWNTLSSDSIKSFQLYKLNTQTNAWDKIRKTITKNEVIQNVSNSDYLAVSPISTLGLEGILSRAINPGKEEVLCFYKSLTVDLIDSLPKLTLEVTGTNKIKNITFQKLHQNKIIDLPVPGAVTPITDFYTAIDELPYEGMNLYRAEIQLINGQSVFTDYSAINIFKNRRFNLFPIPANSGQHIKVLADKYSDYNMRIFDLQGAAVSHTRFTGTEHQLETSAFNKGVYIYNILENNKLVQSGKIVIQ